MKTGAQTTEASSSALGLGPSLASRVGLGLSSGEAHREPRRAKKDLDEHRIIEFEDGSDEGERDGRMDMDSGSGCEWCPFCYLDLLRLIYIPITQRYLSLNSSYQMFLSSLKLRLRVNFLQVFVSVFFLVVL